MTAEQIKSNIKESLLAFAKGNLTEKSIELFENLGYVTERRAPLHKPSFAEFKDTYFGDKKFDEAKAKTKDWKYVDLLFQLSKEEVQKQASLFDIKQVDRTVIETYLFFAIELSHDEYSRTELSVITREVNRLFPMPAMILFKHGKTVTLSAINRRLHKRDESKDVLEKVTLIKDIVIENPHRAHIEILFDISFDELRSKHHFTNFVELHNAWQKTLDTKELNKTFYNDLFKWYLWAKDHAAFPNDNNEDADKFLSESLIRFISRLLFVWFMKEKKLITNDIFDKQQLAGILKNFNTTSQSNVYYKAILQNLFFATLNVPIDDRKWIDGKKRNKAQLGDPLIYRYESEFVKSDDVIENIFMKIPFLNGGLFDCLDDRENNIFVDGYTKNEKKQTQMPNMLFFGQRSNVDLSHHFADDAKEKNKWKTQTVTGIIDLLHNYKFTIEENTPLEVDVALDPELLGKVFENLLASFNPETKTTARKQTGSFYTPREIVNYMVDESLKQYLITHLRQNQTDVENLFLSNVSQCNEGFKKAAVQKLFDCKILDPACGSGAFPMGILHKMVELMTLLDPQNQYLKEIEGHKLDFLIQNAKQLSETNFRNQTVDVLQKQKEILFGAEYDYVRKLYIIENCIYGVDIQPIAIQISKLRFFISLLVEQNKDDKQDNYGIQPLPNMDFKLVAANTLISTPQEDKGIGLFDGHNEFFDLFDQLAHDYFTLYTPEAKKQKKAEITQLINNKVADKVAQINRNKEVAQKADKLEQSVKLWQSYPNLFKEKAVEFFDIPYFFPKVKNGFDVVIGNPPYILIANLRPNDTHEYSKQNFETFSKGSDLYCLFYERGLKLSSANGILTFISSNRFCFTNYGDGLRKYLSNRNILLLINFNEINVFESANVGSIIAIIKNAVPDDKPILIFDAKDEDAISRIKFEKKYSSKVFYQKEQWSFDENIKQKLKQKIEKKGVPFIKWDAITTNRGITTGANNIFIIDERKRSELINEDSKSDEILLPILKGANIKRYFISKPTQYLIYTYTDIKIQDFPAVFNYLKNHKEDLEEVYEAKHGQKKWYELRKCSYYDKFAKKKLVWTRLSNQNTFSISTNSEFTVDSSSFAVGENLEYLASILNSKVVLFYFKLGSVIWGKDGIKWFGKYFDNIPIPKIRKDEQKPFEILVDQILSAKAENPKADTSQLEKQIDEMVYKLYELTDEEIKIIENKK